MGDAAGASKQLVKLAKQPSVLLPLHGGWDEDKIIPKAGSKNIPMLRWANDVVMFDRSGNLNKLDKAFTALSGYFDHAKKHGQFHGEEYSTIYWRWIVLPVWIGWLVATKRGHLTTADKAAKWLTDYVTHCVLGTFYTQGDWYYGGVKTEKDIYVSKRKNWGKRFPGVPTATQGFSRSWVFNKGNNNQREIEDGMSWVDGFNHAVWLSWVLGYHNHQWVGAQPSASDFVGPLVKGFSNQYPNGGFLSNFTALKDMYTTGTLNRDLVQKLEYGPTFPIIYGRNTGGSFAVGTKSYNDGSTCFMHARTYMSDRYYRVYGVANPFKRSNSTPSTAESKDNWQSYTMYTSEGKVWDWIKRKMVAGTKTIHLPTGEWDWLVSVGPGGKSTIFEPSKPVIIDDKTWWQKLIDLLFGWF